MKKYKVLYCGEELDKVTAKNTKEAIRKVTAEYNFEAIEIKEKKHE